MKKYLSNPRFLLAVYILLAMGATLQSYFGNPTTFNNLEYTSYNNYLIFKQSFFHLIENKDLYISYPTEHWDLYKYSPTFALLMAPLAMLPDVIGLLGWNLLNALVLFFALNPSAPKGELSSTLEKNNFNFTALITPLGAGGLAIEMLTSIQNEQSNALIAGLIIFAFVLLEKDKIWLATFCIALTVYIKIFGIVAFALFLVYPKKGKFILSSVVWMAVLGLLPMLFVGVDQFQFLYESWGRMLGADHAASYGLSVMGWLQTWFGLEISKNVIVLLGVILFCLPLVKIKSYSNYGFRWRLLASILIWIVIFNHKAESPTFVIAMSGVGIWYFMKRNYLGDNPSVERTGFKLSPKFDTDTVLVILAFLFTSLSPTDLFPRSLRENLVKPYVLKAVPCIFIWGKIIWEMWNISRLSEPTES